MNNSLSKRTGKPVFAIIILLIIVVFGVYMETRPRIAPGQKPLTDIHNIETLQTQFNQELGKTRLILLVSPT